MRLALSVTLLVLPLCVGGCKNETPRKNVEELTGEFIRDFDKAKAAYDGQEIILTGMVRHINEREGVPNAIALWGKRDLVLCFFADEAVVKKLKQGQTATVHGKCLATKGSGPSLKECTLEAVVEKEDSRIVSVVKDFTSICNSAASRLRQIKDRASAQKAARQLKKETERVQELLKTLETMPRPTQEEWQQAREFSQDAVKAARGLLKESAEFRKHHEGGKVTEPGRKEPAQALLKLNETITAFIDKMDKVEKQQ